MPLDDARRWNERYLLEERYRSFAQPRPFLLAQAHRLPHQGLALDVAMGLGGNASFLLQRGLAVVGVDISAVAVRQAKRLNPALMAVLADLERFELPTGHFDLILSFYYLQRDLWPRYERWLRPGGILIIETLTQEMLAVQPDIDPAFLLAPGELQNAFDQLDILEYREGWNRSSQGHRRAVASLVARRPL